MKAISFTRRSYPIALLAWLAIPTAAGAEEPGSCPPELDTTSIESWMRSDPKKRFASLLEFPENHRLQVLVTVVTRGDGDVLCGRRYGYRVNAEYFYPASTIKIFGAISSLQWMTEQRKTHPNLTLDTPLQVEPSEMELEGESVVLSEASPPQSLRTVIGDTLIRSSNSGFNWLYDVAGPDRLYKPYEAMGLHSVRLRHRLSERGYPRSIQDYAPPVTITKRGQKMFLSIRRTREHPLPPTPLDGLLIGPMDFNDGNAVSLTDLQGVLIALVRPEIGRGGLPLSRVQRAFLRKVLSEVVDDPPPPEAPPDRVRYKPMLSGFRRALGNKRRVHIESKAGRAYGFIVDNAYVRDKRTGREVFVTAVVYANANGIVGDDIYEYETVSLPFFDALGELVAQRLLRPRR